MASRLWPVLGEASVPGVDSVDEAAPVQGAEASTGATGEFVEFGEFGKSAGDLPRRLGPHERLFRRGPRSLSGADLLGLVVRTGGRGRPARDLAPDHPGA